MPLPIAMNPPRTVGRGHTLFGEPDGPDPERASARRRTAGHGPLPQRAGGGLSDAGDAGRAPAMNLRQLLTPTARLHEAAAGLVLGEHQCTRQETDHRVDAMVSGRRASGVRRSGRLLVPSRNQRQMFDRCRVAFRLDCVGVPVNFRHTPPEVAHLGAASAASVKIAETMFADPVAAVRAGCACAFAEGLDQRRGRRSTHANPRLNRRTKAWCG